MSYRTAFYPGSTPGVLTPGGSYPANYRAAFYPGSTPGTLYAGGTYRPVAGTGAVTGQAPNMFSNILNSLFTPTRTVAPGAGVAASNQMPILLIGGAVLLFVLMSKHKKG